MNDIGAASKTRLIIYKHSFIVTNQFKERPDGFLDHLLSL